MIPQFPVGSGEFYNMGRTMGALFLDAAKKRVAEHFISETSPYDQARKEIEPGQNAFRGLLVRAGYNDGQIAELLRWYAEGFKEIVDRTLIMDAEDRRFAETGKRNP